MVCFLCSSPDHSSSRCRELAFPLKDGFQSGGGGGGHSHDDDEDDSMGQRSFGRATHLTVYLAGFSDSVDFSEAAGLEERELFGVVEGEFCLDDCLDEDDD
jgi:hypothetical protein